MALCDRAQQHDHAADAKYAKILRKMSRLLDKWMASQGDKGQQTEMEAFEHIASKMRVK